MSPLDTVSLFPGPSWYQWLSLNSSRYLVLHLFQNPSIVELRCLILLVKPFRVTTHSPSSSQKRPSGRLSDLRPIRKCDGLSCSSVSSHKTYDKGLKFKIVSTSAMVVASSSNDSQALPIAFHKHHFIDPIGCSNIPPHQGGFSKLNCHSILIPA